MSLEIKKVYIDARYRAPDSKSDSDFIIDLPRQFNVPDDVVAYIDDIVIPVSWQTIDIHNQHFYFVVLYGGNNYHYIAVVPAGNYNGSTFAAALKAAIALKTIDHIDDMEINVEYNFTSNIIKISALDKRPVEASMNVCVLNDEAIKGNDYAFGIDVPHSLNEILNIDHTYIVNHQYPFQGYLD